MDLSSLSNGETNEFLHLALVTGTKANSNVLRHREAMKVEDHELFIQAMKEEIEKMTEREIFEVVPCSQVPTYQKVLRALWSHRQKTKPTGEIYRHRFCICADGNKQQYGIVFHQAYSPVVQWSTVRMLLLLSQ
eukprot:11818950-Ditylum_brightwellii.AAC.1